MKRMNARLLCVLLSLCMVVALFPFSAFAAGDNYTRKIVYADSDSENFAFEASGDITIPVAVFVYGTGEKASYELTQEDADGHLVLAGIDAAFGSGVAPGKDFHFDLLSDATITLGELKAAAIPNASFDGTDFSLLTAEQVAQGLMYADLYGCITSMIGTSCTSSGGFKHIKIENGQTWTVPANESLDVVLSLDVNGELLGTDETSMLVFHNWGDSHAEISGDGLSLYADIGEPELLEITADNWDELMAQGGEFFMPAFQWKENKWIYWGDCNNPEPPAPSENQFRLLWDDYLPEGGSKAVAKYRIGEGSEETAIMDVLTDIDEGLSLTFIYTPAKDIDGNAELFWGLEVYFEGEEASVFIEKEKLTENDGTYSYIVERTDNNAGFTVNALRNSPFGGLNDLIVIEDNDNLGGEYDNVVIEESVTASVGEGGLTVHGALSVNGALLGSNAQDAALVLVRHSDGHITEVSGLTLYQNNGNAVTEVTSLDALMNSLGVPEHLENWIAFTYVEDKWVFSQWGTYNDINEPPAPGESQFRLWWDDYVPEGGSEAVAKYIIGNGNEETAQMNILTDIDENAKLTFIYTPAADSSGNPEPFWGIEVCFEGGSLTYIPKEELLVQNGTYSYTVDRLGNNAGLTVGAWRNDPQSEPPGDKELDEDFCGCGEYENVTTNEYTWTVPAGEENKLVVRNSLTVLSGGSLVGTDETSVLEIQTTSNVKGLELYAADGTALMNDPATGELSDVEGFGQWVAFGWQSGKWVLLNVNPCEHSFTRYVSNNNATCVADGTKTAKCDNCDAKDTQTDVGTKKDHSYTGAVKDNGNKTHSFLCVNGCNEYGGTVACEYDSKEKTPATCTEVGTTTYTCPVCANTYDADDIDKLGHSFTSYVSNNNATCLADGTKTAKCERCEVTDTQTDVGTKKDHSYTGAVKDNGNKTHSFLCVNGCNEYGGTANCSYGAWKVTIPATAQADGEEERTCSVCGNKETRSIDRIKKIEIKQETSQLKKLDSGNLGLASSLTRTQLKALLPDNIEISTKPGVDTPYTGMTVTLKDSNGKVVDTITVVVKGDVNGDGKVSAADARLALRQSVGLEALNNVNLEAAKVSGTTEVKAAQARIILRAAVGLEESESLLNKKEK